MIAPFTVAIAVFARSVDSLDPKATRVWRLVRATRWLVLAVPKYSGTRNAVYRA